MTSQRQVDQFDKELVADPTRKVSHGVAELMALMATMPQVGR